MRSAAAEERFRAGFAHEYRVQARLASLGWASHRFALVGQYPSLLSAARSTPLSYMPDILAWRGNDVVLIDAKASDPTPYGFCIVDTAEHDSQARLSLTLRLPVFYVFQRGDTVAIQTFGAHAQPGRNPHGNGSGTPFLSCPNEHLTPFAEVFGP